MAVIDNRLSDHTSSAFVPGNTGIVYTIFNEDRIVDINFALSNQTSAWFSTKNLNPAIHRAIQDMGVFRLANENSTDCNINKSLFIFHDGGFFNPDIFYRGVFRISKQTRQFKSVFVHTADGVFIAVKNTPKSTRQTNRRPIEGIVFIETNVVGKHITGITSSAIIGLLGQQRQLLRRRNLVRVFRRAVAAVVGFGDRAVPRGLCSASQSEHEQDKK